MCHIPVTHIIVSCLYLYAISNGFIFFQILSASQHPESKNLAYILEAGMLLIYSLLLCSILRPELELNCYPCCLSVCCSSTCSYLLRMHVPSHVSAL